jgi:hypothetical protein
VCTTGSGVITQHWNKYMLTIYTGCKRLPYRQGNQYISIIVYVSSNIRIQLFPRGKELSPIDFQYERTASGFFDFAEKQVPFRVKKIGKSEEFDTWTTKVQLI